MGYIHYGFTLKDVVIKIPDNILWTSEQPAKSAFYDFSVSTRSTNNGNLT